MKQRNCCVQPQLQQLAVSYRRVNRVATNLENLEYSGISLNMENLGNSWGILCNLRGKLLQPKYFQFDIQIFV